MGREINHPAAGGPCRQQRWLAQLILAGALPWGGVVANPVGPEYRIVPSPDLEQVVVEVRLPPEQGGVLRAPRGRVSAIRSLQSCGEGPVETRRNRILAGTADGCLRYAYPLQAPSGRRGPAVSRHAVLSSPEEWLWMPESSSPVPIRIELALPGSMVASVPWRSVAPGVFELPPSPGSATAMTVFGAFQQREVMIDGARLRVAAVNGPDLTLDTDRIEAWLTVAANDVAGVGGSFPNPDVQVIVQPVLGRDGSAVPFGYVIRDGGEAVRFFVDPRRSLTDLERDWTATHEFSHLLLPYVRSSEKWVSEGFASYYQNVLLARRGVYSEQEVWDRFHRAFTEAAKIDDPPRPDALHERDFWQVRMLLYWSGAALALTADTTLRAAGNGQSLDVVLGRLARCCLPSERTWTAAELFARLDELAGADVFLPLFDARMREAGMPDLSGLYADLGIEPISERRVRLTRTGGLVAVREAIMAP